MELILIDRPAEGVAVITLNRPEARNALSVALREEACRAFAALGAEPAMRAIVITGAGDKAFSAGVDLRELSNPAGRPKPSAPGADDLAAAIVACPVPVIAAVNGVCITGGFELALACDVILASSTARFADTHARVGLVPAWGMSLRLPRLIGMSRAKQLSFTGDFLDATTAERWGLVNEVLEPADLLPRAIRMATDIAGCDPRAVRNLKRCYDETAGMTMADGMVHERRSSAQHMREVKPEDIANRREAVQARGREQSS